MGDRLIRVWLALMLVASAVQPRESESVLVVLSSGEPYLQMARQTKAVLEGGGSAVTTVRLDSPELKSEMARHNRLVAVGSRAVRRIGTVDWSGTLVFLAYDPAAIGLPDPGQVSPGVTGLALQVSVREQLEKLSELLPDVQRIGVLYDPLKTQKRVSAARDAASQLGLKLVPVGVRVPGELMDQARLLAPQVDAVWALDQSVMTQGSQRALTLFALRARLPLLAISKSYVDRGALAAVVPDLNELGRRAGEMMLEILQGAEPSSIPVESPPQCIVEVNAATSRRLGIDASGSESVETGSRGGTP